MGIKPTSNGTTYKSTVTDSARTIKKQKSNGTDDSDLGQAAHLQSDRNHEEEQGCHFQLRQDRGESDKYCGDAPAGGEDSAIAGHEKEMTEFATERTEQIQEKKLALPDDGFDIPPNKIKNQHVGGEMPDVVMEQWRGEKLPGVGIIDAAVA